MEAVDHLDLVVTDVERSLNFYRELLRPLGYGRESEIEGERGERVIYINRAEDGGSISLRANQSDAHATPYDRYAVGVHHICFSAPSRELVDSIAQAVPGLGGEVESGPEEYPYSPGYYAVFLHDPDGIKLEILHRPEFSEPGQ